MNALSHQATVVLLAAFAKRAKAPLASEIAKVAQPYFEDVASGARYARLIGDELAELIARGFIEGVAPASKSSGKLVRYIVTASGEAALRATFGDRLSKSPWATLIKRHLVPAAAGVGHLQTASEFGVVRAAMIANALRLSQTLERTKTETQMLNRLLAQITGSRVETSAGLGKAIVRGWLAVSTTASVTSPEVDLQSFASSVNEAAHAVAARDGMQKAFINRVWDAARDIAGVRELDEAAFKRRLVEANQRGLVRLTIAAVAPLYPEQDVAASEISWHGETFHLIEV